MGFLARLFSTALPLNPASLLIRVLVFASYVSISRGADSVWAPECALLGAVIALFHAAESWQNPCCLDGSGRKRPEEYEAGLIASRMQPARAPDLLCALLVCGRRLIITGAAQPGCI